MRVSYNWILSYFDAKLPSAEELAEVLTFHAFEIESVEHPPVAGGADTVIDIDVLPNRSSDCLSHRGIARELSTLLDMPLKDDPLGRAAYNTPDSNVLEVDVGNPKLVNRFSAAVVRGVEVGESPQWLRDRLVAIGQKPINNVVDATNYVMFDIGQPLHAFDRDKLVEEGGGYAIAVRTGARGERITLLSGEEYGVGPSDLLIVDGNADRPIGIAGVKGGKLAEVDEGTANIVIEAANFNYVSVRKTSQRLKLRTEASVRFENEPSPELTLHALREVVKLIGGSVEGFVDHYPKPPEREPVSIHVSEVNGLLGTSVSGDEVKAVLKRFGFDYRHAGEVFTVTPPFERNDIKIKEDLIEEIGRVYGYGHVAAVPLPPAGGKPMVNKRFYYSEKIRRLLIERGFSEVYTYTLRSAGEVKLANALAADKPFLRSRLSGGLQESLELNARNADLLGLEQVRIFEIGTVFGSNGEHASLALGACDGKGKALGDVLREAREAIGSHLEVKLPNGEAGAAGAWELNFTELLEKLPDPDMYDISYNFKNDKAARFRPISPYPFVLRDVAMWVPSKSKEQTANIKKVIEEAVGPLLVRAGLFDEFEKDGKVSYAFHLVFQSYERTLTDEEVNRIMEGIYGEIEQKGWEVR